MLCSPVYDFFPEYASDSQKGVKERRKYPAA